MRQALAPNRFPFTPIFLIVVACCAIPACTFDPTEDYQAANQQWTEQWQQAVVTRQKAQGQSLGWDDAVSMIHAQNPNVVSANQNREDAKRRIGLVWKSLLPFVRARLAVTTNLDELDSISSDDVRIDLLAAGFIQGVFELPPNLYGARLNVIGAELEYEKTRREQIIACYALFAAGADLDRREAMLNEIETDLAELAGDGRGKLNERLAAGRQRLADERATIARELAELVNDFSAIWRPDSAGLPPLAPAFNQLAEESLPLEGSLQVQAVALDQVAAAAFVDNAWRDFLPSPGLYFSSPPLYSRNTQGDNTLDYDDITQTSSVDWALDTRGFIKERYLRAEIAEEMAATQSQATLNLLALDLDERRERLAAIDDKHAALQREQALIAKAAGIVAPQRLNEALEMMIDARLREMDLQLERREIILPVLLLDPLWDSLEGQDAS